MNENTLQSNYSESKKNYHDNIIELVNNNPYQLEFAEYAYIADLISEKNGKFLIFSVGNDSELWLEINKKGETIFIEDNLDWLEIIKQKLPSIEVYLVKYETQLTQWQELLEQYKQGQNNLTMELPDIVIQTSWDYIFVDAPAGYDNHFPGRMKSIYAAAQLASNTIQTDVFVHDCNREVEAIYSDYFLKPENLVKEFSRLRHYQIKSDKLT